MSMTEREFQDAVVELAHVFGWSVIHYGAAQTAKGWRTPARYDSKGAPDLTLVHPGGWITFAELKRDKGSGTTPEQIAWGELLTKVSEDIPTVRYVLWKPRHADAIALHLSFGKVTKWALSD